MYILDRFGQRSTIFREVARGEVLASGSDARLRTLLDDQGLPPLAYDDKVSAMSSVRACVCACVRENCARAYTHTTRRGRGGVLVLI